MDSRISDSVLWQKYLSGDEIALGTIAERYVATLKHYGQKFLLDEAVVKDCIQDLFLQLWQNREHISLTPSVKHYLLKGLRNQILMHIRSDKRFVDKRLTLSEPNWDTACPETIDGEAILIQQESFLERVRQLQELMSQLSAREREAIYLHYYEDMSIAEIAEVMEINRQSVSNFMSRAMTKLRERFSSQFLLTFFVLVYKILALY